MYFERTKWETIGIEMHFFLDYLDLFRVNMTAIFPIAS